MALNVESKGQLKVVLEMIKFEHTIFALPFAYSGAWLASGGVPKFVDFILITLAMVGARSAAMALNRLIDMHIDASNPRTASRALPTGMVGPRFVLVFACVGLVVLFGASKALAPICLYLSPLAVFALVGYSYTKRFTWACHLWLGSTLAIAPTGAWLGVTGAFHPVPVLISVGVALWTAGFDIIYACLDVAFDRAHQIQSVPARFGEAKGLLGSKIIYVLSLTAFSLAGVLAAMGIWYYIGLVVVSGLLVYEHLLVGPGRLEKVDLAFTTMNGLVSVVFFIFTAIDLAL